MTTNKGVNRTFLITFLIYVGGSFLWSLIGKRFVDSFYVDIAVSQLLVCVPPFVYLKISGTKTGELIPYKKNQDFRCPFSGGYDVSILPADAGHESADDVFCGQYLSRACDNNGTGESVPQYPVCGIAASLCGGVCVPRSLLSDLPEEQHEGSTGAQRTSVRLYAHEL